MWKPYYLFFPKFFPCPNQLKLVLSLQFSRRMIAVVDPIWYNCISPKRKSFIDYLQKHANYWMTKEAYCMKYEEEWIKLSQSLSPSMIRYRCSLPIDFDRKTFISPSHDTKAIKESEVKAKTLIWRKFYKSEQLCWISDTSVFHSNQIENR